MGRATLRSGETGSGAARLSSATLAAAGAGLVLIAAIVFGPHVLHGGLYRDDWAYWLEYAGAKPGLGGALHAFHWTWFRPLQMLWWPATEAVLGPHPGPQIAFTVALAVLASLLLFRLLTMVGVDRLPAMLIASLVLLFPASDATRLWPAADVGSAGIALYLMGTIASLRGFQRGGRSSVAWHVTGLLLYLASLALYEVAVCGILASVLVYRLRVPWRRAAARWAADLVVVLPFILLVTSHSSSIHQSSSLADVPDHARLYLNQGLTLLSRAIVPFGRPVHLLGLILVAAVLLLGAVRVLSLRRRAERLELRRWLVLAGVGILVIVAGYAPFLMSSDFEPLAGGTNNRVNMVPAIGFALLVCALVMLVTSSLPRVLRSPARGGALLSALGIAILVGYGIDVSADVRQWDQAGTLQRQTLAALSSVLRRPRPGGAKHHRGLPGYVFVFDQAAFTAPGVPVFNEANDLTGALAARLGHPGVIAYPAVRGALYYCEKGDVWMDTSQVTLEDDYGDVSTADYGRTLFVDIRGPRTAFISTSRACDAGLRTYLPGPVLPGG